MLKSVYGADYDWTDSSNEALADRIQGASALFNSRIMPTGETDAATQVTVKVELSAETTKNVSNDLVISGTLDSSAQKKIQQLTVADPMSSAYSADATCVGSDCDFLVVRIIQTAHESAQLQQPSAQSQDGSDTGVQAVAATTLPTAVAGAAAQSSTPGLAKAVIIFWRGQAAALAAKQAANALKVRNVRNTVIINNGTQQSQATVPSTTGSGCPAVQLAAGEVAPYWIAPGAANGVSALIHFSSAKLATFEDAKASANGGASATTCPATTAAPQVTAPAATNSPAPVVAPAATNSPAPVVAPAATNSPAPAPVVAPAVTNSPAPAPVVAPAVTNSPAPAPVIPPAVIVPAPGGGAAQQ
jgi:hypothetical protein